jgi:TatD DNase family protein
VQREVFTKQLTLSRELNLPVIIHSREADADTIAILRAEMKDSEKSGIMHCFNGSLDLMAAVLDLGFMISFAGNVTFKKAEELRAAARVVPLERLLVETDCPFLTPVPYRGQRNEPARVVEVARSLAELRGMTTEEMGLLTATNFASFFNLQLEAGG